MASNKMNEENVIVKEVDQIVDDDIGNHQKIMASTSKDSASPVNKDKPISLSCVNRFCTQRNKQLVPCVQMVCLYYHIKYKPHYRVCTDCFIKCIRHTKNLESRMRSGKCIMKAHFPNYEVLEVIDSSDDDFDEIEESKPTASNVNLSMNEEIKAGLENMMSHVIDQTKDLTEQQDKLCNEYLETDVKTCEKNFGEIEEYILDSFNCFDNIKHKLYDLYKPIITEVGPVDLDELEKKEAIEAEIIRENGIAINRTAYVCPTDVSKEKPLEYPLRPIITELNPVDHDELKEKEANETVIDKEDVIAVKRTACLIPPDLPKEGPLEYPFRPIITELNPVDHDELKEKEANETVIDKEDVIAVKRTACLIPPDLPKERPLEYPFRPIITELNPVDHDELKEKEANETVIDKEDVIAVKRTACLIPPDLPKEGPLEYPPLENGQFVFAMKMSLIKPWYKCKLGFMTNNDFVHIISDFGENFLTRKQVAFYTPNSVRFPLGSRVIAKFTDSDCKVGYYFYAGVIAEPPTLINQFRYMIFFDNGHVQYRDHKDIRLIVHKSNQVWNDVHPDSKDFIRNYLQNYSERQMVRLTKNNFVKVEHKSQWHSANVLEVDASIVKLLFKDLKKSEWLYRGSSRLWNIHEKQSKSEKGIRLRQSGGVARKSTSKSKSSDETTKPTKTSNNCNNAITLAISKTGFSPQPFSKHCCTIDCIELTGYDYNKTAKINMLAIPLHFGFKRYLAYFNDNQKSVWYKAPCGRTIRNITEMYKFLLATNNTMTIQLFDFSSWVNPLSEYKVLNSIQFIKDLSEGKEFRAITCVNNINNELPPPMKYITVRQPMSGVNINVDGDFLTGCNCTDNCLDKSKCSCWEMTINGQKKLPCLYKDPNVGYSHQRLSECVLTGIYECNKTCKCSELCLNRVVQHPLSQNLQLFLTEKKGWGVRCLNDIPIGGFICIYVGYLLTETDANEGGKNYGDEYLAALDYIEVVEKIKEDYESDVVLSDQEDTDSKKNDNKCVTSSELSDDDSQTSEGTVSDILLRLRKRKKTKKHTKNKKRDGRQVHVPSRVNTRDMKSNPKPPKSVREYFGKNEGVYVMDAKTSGNIGRYFNHSCNPNTFVQNVFVDTHDLRFPWITFFALHYIEAGTELTWDYNYEIGSVPGKKMKCHCKSSNCRGRLL